MTVLAKPSSDLLASLNGRLPSSDEEILEAIRLGEEAIKAGRTVPAEEVVEKMRRIVSKGKNGSPVSGHACWLCSN